MENILRDKNGRFIKGTRASPDTEFKKGIHPETEFKKGQIPWMKGKHHSEETKTKIRVANLGNHHTEETKKKISENSKAYMCWNKGKKASEETKRKMSESRKGNKNWNWKGGISPLRNIVISRFEYRQWRSDVFTRDDFTCQECGQVGGILNAHHIRNYSSIIQKYEITTVEEALECEELWNINNGITFCEECHKKTDNYLVHKKTKINRG